MERKPLFDPDYERLYNRRIGIVCIIHAVVVAALVILGNLYWPPK